MKNSFLGGGYLISVVIIWVFSSTTIQKVFETYPKPYFLTYCTTSLFSFYLLPSCIKSKHKQPFNQIILTSVKFCPLWFLSNYFFNISLNMTSVASNTILASTSGVFTLLFSIIFLKDESSFVKWTAVLVSFMGIVFIGLAEQSTEKDNLVGDLFALAGAIFYSGYSVCLKTLDSDLTITVFGCVGLINFIFLLPGIALLNLVQIEPFLAPNEFELSLIIGNALVGSMICDLCWARSVDYLTPTVCTLGLSFTIPISMAVDKYLKESEFELSYLVGAALVLVGFVLIAWSEEDSSLGIKGEDELLINEEEI